MSSSPQACSGTSLAIAHMKAMSSRAMAVTATLASLPRETRRRNRAHSRTWAFHEIAWMGAGSFSRRVRISSDTLALKR